MPPPSSFAVPCLFLPHPGAPVLLAPLLHINPLPPKQAAPWQSSWHPQSERQQPKPHQFHPHNSPVLLISIFFFCHASDVFWTRSQDLQLSSHIPKITRLPLSSLPQLPAGLGLRHAVTPSVLQALSASQINDLPTESALQLLPPGRQCHEIVSYPALILRYNVGNLYLRPLWPIYFGHNHFADPKVLQQQKNRQLKSHFLRKPVSTHSPHIYIFQSLFEWAVYPRKPSTFYLLCRSRYPDHQTSQSLMQNSYRNVLQFGLKQAHTLRA